MKNLVVYREPKLKPLPPSLQLVPALSREAVRDVPLPVRVENMRKAIQECKDLSELTRGKSYLEGELAKSMKILRHTVPEAVKGLNLLVKTAVFAVAEQVCRYSKVCNVKGVAGGFKSERLIATDALGLDRTEVYAYSKIGETSKSWQQRILRDDKVKGSVHAIARRAPTRKTAGNVRTDVYSRLMRGGVHGNGLSTASYCARNAANAVTVEELRALPDDEKKRVRDKLAEIMEYLDVIDEACK